MQARQCLALRGALPFMADPTVGSPDGALLSSAIQHAKRLGLAKVGDVVVISQCPRSGSSDTMTESGIVKLVRVEEDEVYAAQAGGRRDMQLMHVGSVSEHLNDMAIGRS